MNTDTSVFWLDKNLHNLLISKSIMIMNNVISCITLKTTKGRWLQKS